MSTSSKWTKAARHNGLAIVFGALVAGLSLTAPAGIVETELKLAKSGAQDKGNEVKAKSDTSGSINYQLRCWQYGKLIFEEDHLSLPPDTQVAYKLTLRERDARRAPVHLLETLNATCLAQPSRGPKENAK